MDHLLTRVVTVQTGLRRIGDLLAAVNQHVVPGLVAVGLTPIGDPSLTSKGESTDNVLTQIIGTTSNNSGFLPKTKVL